MLIEDDGITILAWQLFERTGNVGFYLLNKNLIKDKQKEENEKRR